MISIIVPAYNEEENIESLTSEIKKARLKKYDLIIINDGSNDRTKETAEKIAKKERNIRIISHRKNLGLGAALRTGFRAAKGDIIVTMDSDLTHPPSMISLLTDKLEQTKSDVCIASRYVRGGGMKNISAWRVLISKIANVFFSVVFRINARDITSGFKAYKSEKIKAVKIERTDFASQLEIMVGLKRMNAKFCEIPLILETRKKGASKFRPIMYLKYLSVIKDLI